MSLIFPKKEILYAPMIGTLGGGSVRGWGRGKGKGVTFLQSFLSPGTYATTLSAGDYTLFISGGGGGASLHSDGTVQGHGGTGGLFMFNFTASGPSDYDIGIGAAATGRTRGDSSSYAMRGGFGYMDGNSRQSGGGGGGSYLKITTNTNNVVNIDGYVAAVGGGGGGAHHGFAANVGGDGYGVGGGAYDSSWPNTSYGGNNGYDGNNGDGGSGQSGGSTGGYASGSTLVGGDGRASSSDNYGGAGGGGAGGGGGGAGGGSGYNGFGGGRITVSGGNSGPTRFPPIGGGGGGSHGSNCGGCGGGGGALLFEAHTPWWSQYTGLGNAISSLCPSQQTVAVQSAVDFGHYNLIPEDERNSISGLANKGRGQTGSHSSQSGFALLYEGTIEP